MGRRDEEANERARGGERAGDSAGGLGLGYYYDSTVLLRLDGEV